MPLWPPPRRPRRKIGDFCERLWVARRATTHTKGLDLLNSCKLAGQWTELARCSRCPISGWIRAVSIRCTSADTAAFATPGLAATATTATKTCEAQAAASGSSLSASCQAFGWSECRWVGVCAYVRTGTRLHALADVSLEITLASDLGLHRLRLSPLVVLLPQRPWLPASQALRARACSSMCDGGGVDDDRPRTTQGSDPKAQSHKQFGSWVEGLRSSRPHGFS